MTRSKFTDLVTQAAVFTLAAACLALAAYKVIQLRNMGDVPADMGLNFPEPKRKIITDDAIEADKMPTGSIDGTGSSESKWTPRQPYFSEAPIQDYRLLAVIGGVAFVEVLTLKGKEVLPMVIGTRLPGAGTVQHIELRDGRWVLSAGDVKLVAERP